ncbi:MAG: hypothetical protein KBH12_07450 [Synergistaceae bacterium]|nr:hypothetical protein [Synergistaceae bacterium]MBP9627057.1 hypothetical protein [Synergistaceae bacterium]
MKLSLYLYGRSADTLVKSISWLIVFPLLIVSFFIITSDGHNVNLGNPPVDSNSFLSNIVRMSHVYATYQSSIERVSCRDVSQRGRGRHIALLSGMDVSCFEFPFFMVPPLNDTHIIDEWNARIGGEQASMPKADMVARE